MSEAQLSQYLPVLMLGMLAVVFSFGMLGMSVVLGKRGKRPAVKDTPYECGMVPMGEGTPRFSIKFYLVAMLFILFDVEVIFFLPWAVAFKRLGVYALVEMFIFVAILMVGFVYIWKKGALEWE